MELKEVLNEISILDSNYRTIPLPSCCASHRGNTIRYLKECVEHLQCAIQALGGGGDGGIEIEPSSTESIRRWERFTGRLPNQVQDGKESWISGDASDANGFQDE